jgi:hypothetical protein
MAFTVLLEEGSPRAKFIDDLFMWKLLNLASFSDWTPPLVQAARKALKKNPQEPAGSVNEEPEAWYGRGLAVAYAESERIRFYCMGLVSASLEQSAKTERKLQETLQTMMGKSADDAKFILECAAGEPRRHWERLLQTVESVRENLSRAIEAGKKPIPPPSGFFAKMFRSSSAGESLASKEIQDAMAKAMNELEPLRARLQAAIAEMEKN